MIMTNREARFFVGRCLSLQICRDKMEAIRDYIRSGKVEWERVVWVSTGELVFPALYIQLDRAGLLAELPPELVEYMKEFTARNRDRNLQIVRQAKDVSAILNQNSICPIFLKGTAHLLDNLYSDIGERMVGDIDILVEEKDMVSAVDILKSMGYYCPEKTGFELKWMHRHYPILIRDGEIAGVEVHRWMVEMPYRKVFNYDFVYTAKKDLSVLPGAFVLSDDHQILLNMMVVLMNDSGYRRGTIYFRPVYDLLLLSERREPLLVAKQLGHYFHRFNAYLAVASRLLDSPPGLGFVPDWRSGLFLNRFMLEITYPKFVRLYKFPIRLFERMLSYFNLLVQSIYRKDIRRQLISKLSDPAWYRKHFSNLPQGD